MPAIIVATQHAKAVEPPILYLQSPDIIPTGIPIYDPPSIEDIITINPLELAGIPLISIVKYDARIPIMEHMTICEIMVLREVSPLTMEITTPI